MKLTLILALIITAGCMRAQTASPAAPTPTPAVSVPAPIQWSVTGVGMPADLLTALKAQWTAAQSAASADASEVAFAVAQQAAVEAELNAYATAAPTTPVSVSVRRTVRYLSAVTSRSQLMFNVVQVTNFIN